MALDLSALSAAEAEAAKAGEPLLLPLDLLDEDPDNPRKEFPPTELAELADDIRLRGVLQPIVVAPPTPAGRYLIRFGAKRFRASRLAGKTEVPVVISREERFDGYAQVAENMKRHGLSALDLARFMRSRVEAGESNATIAKGLLIDQTTVAHHLALLELPPVLERALSSGRCSAPRTLYELAKLHEKNPDAVAQLVTGDAEITRAVVSRLRASAALPSGRAADVQALPEVEALLERATEIWPQLEDLIDQLKQAAGTSGAAQETLLLVRRRLHALARR